MKPGALVLLAALAVAIGGCAAVSLLLQRPARLGDCEGSIAPVATLPGDDFRSREQARFRGAGVDTGLDLAIERRGDSLTVVGTNAFGARMFALVQRGLDVETQAAWARALPVPPVAVLRDLHAAGFAAADGPIRRVVARPGCDYTAIFVRVSREPLR